MESLAGRMKFCLEGEDLTFVGEKPYVRICYDISVPTLANFIVAGWQLRVPDIIVTVVSGIRSSRSWRKDELRYAFQRGFTKLFNTANAWIFTHGFNQGVPKLIGEAVKVEEDRRSHTVMRRGNTVQRFYNKKLPKIFLFGIAAKNVLRDPEPFNKPPPTGGDVLHYEFGDMQIRQRYDLNPHHTHFIIVNESDYSKTIKLRVELEKELHLYANQQKYSSSNNNPMQLDNISDSSSEEDDNAGAVFNDFPTSGSNTATDDTASLDAAAQKAGFGTTPAGGGKAGGAIPMICIFVQGGPQQLEQMLFYLSNNIPCVLVKGSGLMADIVAAVHDEVFAEASTTLDDAELQSLRADVIGRLRRHFSRELPSRRALEHCYNKIAEAMRLACPHGRHLLSVCNLTTASDYVDLDKFILKALFASQESDAFRNPEQIRSDLLLTVKWNHPRLAQTHIFQNEGWSRWKIDKNVFDQALLLLRRESFIDMFLEQGFKLHKYVTHRRLLYLYRHAEDTEFFHSVVLEGILNYPTGSPVYESFVIDELNPLLYVLSKLRDFINVYVLACNAFGVNQTEDAAAAERRALLALLVWAILLNRYKLAVVLWKHCDHPIPTALFASHMYTQLARLCNEIELKDTLYQNGKSFSEMAVEILELGYYNDNGGSLAFEELETHYAEFNHKTPIIMGYEARNLWFLAHPCCQKWLSQLYQGKISVVKVHHMDPISRVVPESVKIVLSAWLILPMFLWIRFPKVYTLNNGSIDGTTRNDGVASMLRLSDADANNLPSTGIAAVSSATAAVIKRVQSDIRKQAKFQKSQLLLRPSSTSAYKTSLRSTTVVSTTQTSVSQKKSATPLPDTGGGRQSLALPPLTLGNAAAMTTGQTHNFLPPLPGMRQNITAAPSDTAVAASITVPMQQPLADQQHHSWLSPALPLSSQGIHAESRSDNREEAQTPAAVETTEVIQIHRQSYRQSQPINQQQPRTSQFYNRLSVAAAGSTTAVLPQQPAIKRVRSATDNFAQAPAGVLLQPRMAEHELREQELQYIAEKQRIAERRGCTRLVRHRSRQAKNRRDGARRLLPTSFAFDGGGGAVLAYEETTIEDELPLARKIYYLWQAPITKFWSCLFAYIAFLVFYSVVAFIPECDGVYINFVLDVVMWLWTALIIVEIALRTFHQQHIGVPFHWRRRMTEIGVLTMFLVLYTALRVLYYCNIQSISPLVSRVIMLNGLLYFYLRILSLFFPISREMGPLVVRVRVMMFGALVGFLKLVAPFFFAYMIVIQIILYPDRSLNAATLLQAFRRAIYSFFTTQLGELDESSSCAAVRTENKPFCMVGAYTDPTCPNQTVLSYFYLLQWMFIFKLVLMSLLYAFFTNHTMRISQESEVIWKYQRYQLVLDIATRSALPPPLSIVPHAIWLFRSLAGKCWRCGSQLAAGASGGRHLHKAAGGAGAATCPRLPPAYSATSPSIAQQHARDVLYKTRRGARMSAIGTPTAGWGVSGKRRCATDLCDNQTCPGTAIVFAGSSGGDPANSKQRRATLRALNPSNYWQVMARQYWRDRQVKELEQNKPDKQFQTVIAIKDELDQAKVANKRMRNRVVALERLLLVSLKRNNTQQPATTVLVEPPAAAQQ